MAYLDPQTGLDLDDPTNQQLIASQVAPGSPEFAALRDARAQGLNVDDPTTRQMVLAGGAPPSLINRTPATGTVGDVQARVDASPALVQPPPPPAPPAAPPPVANDNAAPAAAPVVAPPPPEVKATSTWTQGESFVKPTKEFQQARVEEKTASAGEKAAAGKAADAAVAEAKANAEAADQAAQITKTANEERAAKVKTQQDLYQAGKAELDQQRQKVIADGGRGYWQDKSTGSLIASALMAGIGQWASTMTGGPDQALNVINQNVDRDALRKRQTAQLELERLGLKGQDLRERLDLATIEINNGKAAILESLKVDREARLAKAGIVGAEAAKDVILAGLDQKQAALNLQIEASLNHHVEKTTGGSQVVDTGKPDGGAGGRAAGIQIQKAQIAEKGARALETIDALHKKGVSLSEKDRQKIQENQRDVAAQEHMNPILGKLGRATVLARSPFEGLSADKQTLAQNYEVLTQTGALLGSSSHSEEEMKHARGLYDLNAPGVGDKARQDALERARGLIGSSGGLGGKYTDIAKRGAEGAAGQGTPIPQQKPKLAPIEIAKLNRALKTASPEDALRIRQTLAGVGQ